MNLISFKQTLTENKPPENISKCLSALWQEKKGNWDKAHNIVQDLEDKDAAWIHAYLHRKEGDIGNADYWYRRAGKKRPDVSLEKEWEEIVIAFL